MLYSVYFLHFVAESLKSVIAASQSGITKLQANYKLITSNIEGEIVFSTTLQNSYARNCVVSTICDQFIEKRGNGTPNRTSRNYKQTTCQLQANCKQTTSKVQANYKQITSEIEGGFECDKMQQNCYAGLFVLHFVTK